MESLLDRAEVSAVLHGFNPWWTGRPVPVPPFQRIVYRTCRRLLERSELRRAILLSGPRRVGKTTILLQIAAALAQEGSDPRGIFYASLDHPLLRLAGETPAPAAPVSRRGPARRPAVPAAPGRGPVRQGLGHGGQAPGGPCTVCLPTGGILSHQAVARALKVSAATVASHLEFLRQANLVYCVPPARLGGKKVLKARNRYCLVDAALRNAVLLKGEEVLTDPVQAGTIVETPVLRHLTAYHCADSPEIVYWRDPATGKEVDLIVRSPAYILPFEVKYRDSAGLDARSGLATWCVSEKAPVPLAFLVTKRDGDFGAARLPGTSTQLMRVPAHVLCFLLGQAERGAQRKAAGSAHRRGPAPGEHGSRDQAVDHPVHDELDGGGPEHPLPDRLGR